MTDFLNTSLLLPQKKSDALISPLVPSDYTKGQGENTGAMHFSVSLHC